MRFRHHHLPRLGSILVLGALLSLTVLVSPSGAAAASPCWKQVVQDYYDNYRVDDTYPVSCYRKAIEELPTDVEQYSNAADEIRRALQESLSRPSAGGTTTTPASATTTARTDTTPAPPAESVTTTPPPPPTTTTTPPTTTPPTTTEGGQATPLPSGKGGGGGDGNAGATPGGNGGGNSGDGAGSPGDSGNKQATGSGGKPLDVLRPDKADSFPLPLIILAAVALLLLAAGGAGYVARRMQRNRLQALPQGDGSGSGAPTPPALPPPDARRD